VRPRCLRTAPLFQVLTFPFSSLLVYHSLTRACAGLADTINASTLTVNALDARVTVLTKEVTEVGDGVVANYRTDIAINLKGTPPPPPLYRPTSPATTARITITINLNRYLHPFSHHPLLNPPSLSRSAPSNHPLPTGRFRVLLLPPHLNCKPLVTT
jgi:hypothetical protein